MRLTQIVLFSVLVTWFWYHIQSRNNSLFASRTRRSISCDFSVLLHWFFSSQTCTCGRWTNAIGHRTAGNLYVTRTIVCHVCHSYISSLYNDDIIFITQLSFGNGRVQLAFPSQTVRVVGTDWSWLTANWSGRARLTGEPSGCLVPMFMFWRKYIIFLGILFLQIRGADTLPSIADLWSCEFWHYSYFLISNNINFMTDDWFKLEMYF